MLGLRATVHADASAALCRWILDGLCPIGRFAIGRFAIGDAWNVLHDRQAALEPRRLGNGYMVAEGGNLVANTLKGVAVPTTIYNKATCNGIALGLVANKFNVHIFLVFSYVASRGCALLAGGVGFAEATSLAIAVLVVDADE